MEITKPDLIIVVDATASMQKYLNSLSSSLSQIARIIDITNSIDLITVIAYRDYCDNSIIQTIQPTSQINNLISFCGELKADGGGDIPEAAKTAAHKVLDIVTKPTIVFWYTDAPPHHLSNMESNFEKESNTLKKKEKTFDWIEIANLFAKKQITVYPIINTKNFLTSSFYILLAKMTSGKSLFLPEISSEIISRVTIKVFLALMGYIQDFEKEVEQIEYTNFDLLNIRDENHHDGYLPGDKIQKTIKAIVPDIARYSGFANHSLRDLTKLFQHNNYFKKRVYDTYLQLFRSEDILSLTYNTIFAAFWRLICRDFENPLRSELREQLSKTLLNLKKKNTRIYDIVSKWISESYNQNYEIYQTITSVKSSVPALIFETSTIYTPQSLLELNYSCNPKILSKVNEMLTGLRIIEKTENLPKNIINSSEEVPIVKYIPLELSNRLLFSTLSHLIAPGCMFSLRPSLILATLAYISGGILKERAQEHLEYHRGKWINNESEENFAPNFIKLMLTVPQFLTDTEKSNFEILIKAHGIAINGSTELTAKLPTKPYKNVWNDYKVECYNCKIKRSFTIMTRDKNSHLICGMCCDDNNTNKFKNCDVKDYQLYPESQDDKHSHYLECNQCHALYAIVRPNLLFCNPKCHGCRYNMNLSRITCNKCHNIYLDPANIYGDDKKFECSNCHENPKLSIEEKLILFRDIYHENKNIIFNTIGISLPTDLNPFHGISLYQYRDKIKYLTTLNYNICLKYHGKPILNPNEILKEIQFWIMSGNSEKAACMICFDEFSKNNLREVCGRSSCFTKVCWTCLNSWYSVNRPGNVVLINHLLCPFCKRTPQSQILLRCNRNMCGVMRYKNQLEFDANMWYGWCRQCYFIKPIVAQQCSQEAPKLESKFICQDCQSIKKPEKAEICPNKNCGIAIIKDGGCNHIKCSACETHFCWLCHDVAYTNADETYEHIYQVHSNN